MMKKLTMLLLTLCMTASLAVPAGAAGPNEYTFSGTGDPEYGKPTSIEVVYTADGGAMKNEDISKNAALIPPGFGTPSADTPHTGTPLTPNLAPGYQPEKSSVVSGRAAAVQPPAADGSLYVPGSSTVTIANSGSASSGYTEVTDDLYYKNGSLGTLKSPAIDLTVNIYQGTDSASLQKGAGHFEDTSIWDGNVGLAAHNRNSYFGKIHKLEPGDLITLTTRLGTRTYEVTSASKVSVTDRSSLTATADNCITLYTCVQDQPEYRWCVRGVELR